MMHGRIAEQGTLEKLRQDGVAYTPWSMEPNELSELIAFLDGCEVWPSHVSTKADQTFHKPLAVARTDGEWPAFAPHMDSVVQAPHWLEYAMKMFPIVRDYFGEFPRLYSINIFWTQPAKYKYPETHDWHRDGDDRKQLGLFLFGTEVNLENGTHLYQRGTHRHLDGRVRNGADVNAEHAELDREIGNQYHHPHDEVIEKIYGAAGTMFLEDPNGVHMGKRPKRPRMFGWARWGVSNPPVSYSVWDKLRPCPRHLIGDRYPSDPELQEAIRLVVA